MEILLTNIQSELSCTDLFKAKLPCFNFFIEAIYFTSLLYTSTALAFGYSCFNKSLLILVVIIAEYSEGTILSGNLRDHFTFAEDLKCLFFLLNA